MNNININEFMQTVRKLSVEQQERLYLMIKGAVIAVKAEKKT